MAEIRFDGPAFFLVRKGGTVVEMKTGQAPFTDRIVYGDSTLEASVTLVGPTELLVRLHAEPALQVELSGGPPGEDNLTIRVIGRFRIVDPRFEEVGWRVPASTTSRCTLGCAVEEEAPGDSALSASAISETLFGVLHDKKARAQITTLSHGVSHPARTFRWDEDFTNPSDELDGGISQWYVVDVRLNAKKMGSEGTATARAVFGASPGNATATLTISDPGRKSGKGGRNADS